MKTKKSFKVGDKIVDFGQVCRVFKIRKKKNDKGEKVKFIHYRPYFKTRRNKTLSYSISLENIDKTQIREPVLKKELKKICRKLRQRVEEKKPVNTSRLRQALRENDFTKTAQALKILWDDRKDESTNFTKTKKDVYRIALKRVANELGFLEGLSLKEAKEKIKSLLEQGTPPKQEDDQD
jgi:RNA polymerase-interacting CarD/CdnL/TRCF family regulator